MFSIKLQCNIDNLKSKYLIKYCLANKASIFVVEKPSAKPLCFSSTIFLSMVTLQQPLKNKNLLRT